MPTQRRLSRYDLATIFLFTGIIFALTATYFIVSAKRDLITESQLASVSGTIRSVEHVWIKGHGDQLYIDVIASDGRHDLSQDDISDLFPALNGLQAGDMIDVRVRRGPFGGERFWEIKRDGAVILSYQQTNQFFIDALARITPVAHTLIQVSLFFLAGSAILRICFGRWTGNQIASDAEPPNSPAE